jgi:NNP family nitrate/nitrite transporter-like MFS transporter
MVRPVGGWISDKVGGASVTFWTFVGMMLAVLGVLYFLPSASGAGDRIAHDG